MYLLCFDRNITMSEVTLYKPNELIGAIDKLEVPRTAKHLLNFFLQYAQHEIKFNNHQGTEFEVDISHINGLADIHSHDYERLKQTLITLQQPVILRDDPKHFVSLNPVNSINIDVPNGKYQFELSIKVVRVLAVTDYFSKLQLSEFNLLQSKHSIIIYEWLKRYETAPKGIPQLSIEDLRKITNTEQKKTYDNFRHIQTKIIDVAVREINDTTPYVVGYTTIKERTRYRPKVTAIQFSFKRKDPIPEAISINDQKDKDADPVYLKLKRRCGPFFTLEFFYKLTYLYYPDTLHQYAEDLAAKRHTLAEESYFNDWLEERCSRRRKGYNKRLQVYSEEFFRHVFTTSEVDPDSILHTLEGREVWLGKTKKTVHEEYVTKAMDFYGKLPYDEYRHYLSGIWDEFQKEFNVIADNKFKQ